jgi:hypothetical protein
VSGWAAKNVSQLNGSVGASQPNLAHPLAHHLAHHLAVLYRSGWLSRRCDGSPVVCRIADDRLGRQAQWLATQSFGA